MAENSYDQVLANATEEEYAVATHTTSYVLPATSPSANSSFIHKILVFQPNSSEKCLLSSHINSLGNRTPTDSLKALRYSWQVFRITVKK